MAAIQHENVTLRGSLVELRTLTADGWGVAQLELQSSRELVAVTGKLFTIRVGDAVEVVGSWTDHPRYGRQLKLKSCTPVRPETADGVVLWLTSRLPDIGPSRARALVTQFGEDLWRVIEKEPARLAEVDGITQARAATIQAAYGEVSAEREHMVKLRGWGLTHNQVVRCVKAWGSLDAVIEHVCADPYELAYVVEGFGFKRADKVALAMGIAHDAPVRIRAGIVYTLDEGASQGHCFVAGKRLRIIAAEKLGVSEELVVPQIFAVVEAQRAVRRGWRVYSARLDRAEAACAVALRQLTGR